MVLITYERTFDNPPKKEHFISQFKFITTNRINAQHIINRWNVMGLPKPKDNPYGVTWSYSYKIIDIEDNYSKEDYPVLGVPY